MGWGFSVTPDELEAVGDRLDVVADDLERVDDSAAGAVAYRDDLGHDGLTGVVGSFETNWSIKRHELVGDLHRLAGFARGAAQAYRETDEGVAASMASPTTVISGEPA